MFSGANVVKGALRGTRMNLKQYAVAMARRNNFTTQIENFLAQWDAWLVPTTATPAFPHQPVGKAFVIEGQKVPSARCSLADRQVICSTGVCSSCNEEDRYQWLRFRFLHFDYYSGKCIRPGSSVNVTVQSSLDLSF